MKTVPQLAKEIVSREGGYVNDKDDPGGPTKYGVTIGTMRALSMDLNGDGRVDTADVRALTEEQATIIYVKHYFIKPKIDELPQGLQPPVFDMYVNAGSNAVKILQRLCGVQDDGQIGPKTVAAAQGISADQYGIARRNYYYALGDARPPMRKYCRRRDGGKGGWIVRAEEFMSPKFHLTAAQHAARVAKWC